MDNEGVRGGGEEQGVGFSLYIFFIFDINNVVAK